MFLPIMANKDNNKHLKIMQANLGRGRIASSELLQEAVNKDVALLLIQEPYTRDGKVCGFGRYSSSFITDDKQGEAPMAYSPAGTSPAERDPDPDPSEGPRASLFSKRWESDPPSSRHHKLAYKFRDRRPCQPDNLVSHPIQPWRLLPFHSPYRPSYFIPPKVLMPIPKHYLPPAIPCIIPRKKSCK
ncbi:unnamed protein product [Trichogramma brassicae]|uniref:Endonuclease/exonuclease/phosphatase domain-containing protein n=1 Tax=Trichogramma brassicae TaxID=86971 RepID=A0A6H5IAF3_9HYME|nr:unnamed protein product [Trichogramma brassicae]